MDEEEMRLDTEFREAHPKLTIEEQIAHMRDDRGVKFNIMSEEAAADFLHYNSYYFKIKAFRKNYSKYNSGPNCGLPFHGGVAPSKSELSADAISSSEIVCVPC